MASLPTNFVAIDFETTGLNPWRGDRPFAAAAAFPSGRRLFWNNRDFSGLDEIKADPTIDKVFTNAKFDWRMAEFAGMKVKGQIWDTMILCHLLDGRQNLGLGDTAEKYLPAQKRKYTEEIKQWFDERGIKQKKFYKFDELPVEMLQKRVTSDADLSLRLFARLFPTVSACFPLLLKQEHDLLPVVKRMEDRGLLIDEDEIEKQIIDFSQKVEEVRLFCEGVLGREDFNPASSKDQIELLQKGGCWDQLVEWSKRSPKLRTPTGRPKLDDYNLRNLHHPMAHMMLLGKACDKMRSTFLEGMRERAVDGVVHGSFNQVGTTTGRFSSSDPNLQNIPIEGDRRTAYTEDEANEAFEMTGMEYAPHLKRIFKVRPGYCHIHSDKSRAEIVMLAHYSQDPILIELMKKEGADIHAEICQRLYNETTKGLRTRTKAVVFGFMYGAGLETLARKIGSTVDVARDTKNRLGRLLPGLPRWQRELANQISDRGYVQTDHGRRHYLTSSEAYIAVNRMCQGSVGDEIKSRMVAIQSRLDSAGVDGSVLMNIHDDIGTEVPAEMAPTLVPLIKEIMTDTIIPYRLPVPSSLDVSYTRWSDLVEVKDVSKVPSPAEAMEMFNAKNKKK